MSASGQYACLSVDSNPGMYYSSNYGQSWTIASGVTNTYNVCMSASGQYVIAVGASTGTNYIYYSVNYGVSWIASSQFASGNWYGCAISSNGQYLLAVNASAINAVQSITRFPPQSITSQSTTTSTALSLLAPNIASAQNVGIILGRSITSNNYATIGFNNISTDSATNYLYLGVTTATTLCITASGTVGIGTTATGAYTLNVTGSIYATGDITALSDKRQKQNIIPLEQSLNLLTQLTGYSYTRLGSTNKEHIGLIAQEVNEVFPQSVTYDDELGLYSLNYGCLIAPVIQAIKELKQTVDKLQEKVDRQDAIIQIFLDHFGPQQ
jgi:hypothetical protein